jgi:gliding motility-associated-like protein
MLDSCLKEITLINNSSSADHYLWSFGDGYTDTVFSPTHIYLNQGSYQIQLIASNSCNSDTFSLNIIIPDFVFPIADFSVNLDTCTKTISCVNSSGNADQYLWYFGDGQSDTAWNPVHVYTTANIFHILLTVSNNCGADSIDIPVAIPDYLNVNADFLFTTDSCNLSASFMNLSVNASQYYWNFGDSVNGNFQNGIHTYADTGSYMVMLIAQNTCTSDTIFKPVRISMINVTGNFDVSADTCELSVQVVNMISGASSFYWNFGDGGYDTATNPHHFYTQPGTYVISVISNPFSNCSDTMLSSITFEDGSANYFFLPNVFTPNDDGLNDLFEISGNESCLDFTLKVYNRWGEQIFTTDTPFQKFWDGRFKGKPVPDGTYVYLIDGKQVHRGGVVSILR